MDDNEFLLRVERAGLDKPTMVNVMKWPSGTVFTNGDGVFLRVPGGVVSLTSDTTWVDSEHRDRPLDFAGVRRVKARLVITEEPS